DALGLLERVGPGDGNRLVDLRAVATDTDGTDHPPVEPDGHSALQRRAVGQRERRNAARANLLLELPAWPPIDGRRPRLPDADVDAGHLRVVEPMEENQVATVVDDRDDDPDPAGPGRGGDSLCPGEGQYLLVERLGLRTRGD